MIKNRAWFLDEACTPSTLHINYDNDQNEPWCVVTDFKVGKTADLKKVGVLYFYVEKSKTAKIENILKWDFLPNNSSILLANSKALNVLQQEAKGEFQVIPTHIMMPDETVIKDYKLINITNRVRMLIPEKSILSKTQYSQNVKMYDKCYYNLYGLGEANLAIDSEEIAFFGSSKLKKAVKKAKLKGLNFADRRGNSFFFHDEESYQNDRMFDAFAAEIVKQENEELYPYTKERKAFIQDMLKSFPEVEKYRNDAKKGELYLFNMDLIHFGRLLAKAIIYGKNKLAKHILEKIEKFLKQSNTESKDLITHLLFQETVRYIADEEKYHKVFISMLEPLSKECCREITKRMKIKIVGL